MKPDLAKILIILFAVFLLCTTVLTPKKEGMTANNIYTRLGKDVYIYAKNSKRLLDNLDDYGFGGFLNTKQKEVAAKRARRSFARAFKRLNDSPEYNRKIQEYKKVANR